MTKVEMLNEALDLAEKIERWAMETERKARELHEEAHQRVGGIRLQLADEAREEAATEGK